MPRRLWYFHRCSQNFPSNDAGASITSTRGTEAVCSPLDRKGTGLQIKSQALEANIASYHVDVTIDEKFVPLQEVMSRYYGLTESLNTF